MLPIRNNCFCWPFWWDRASSQQLIVNFIAGGLARITSEVTPGVMAVRLDRSTAPVGNRSPFQTFLMSL